MFGPRGGSANPKKEETPTVTDGERSRGSLRGTEKVCRKSPALKIVELPARGAALSKKRPRHKKRVQ